MDTTTAISAIAGNNKPSGKVQLEAWQYLIDTEVIWRLQSWFGRTARELIKAGVCHEK